jgi:hypothetical protein
MRGLGRVVAVATFCIGGWTAGAVVAASPALACVIAPGTFTCAPDNLTVSPSSTLVSQKTNTVTTCPNTKCLTAVYREDVYRDPAPNAVCPGGSCLTWLVQVTNNAGSSDIAARVTISDFAGFATDIGIETNTPPAGSGFSTGTVVPNNVSRDNSGNLAWDFFSQSIAAGSTSVVLEVQTNAQAVVPGTISVQDGSATSDPAFGPAVPEAVWVPALGLAGGGVLGLFALRRRRAQRKIAE